MMRYKVLPAVLISVVVLTGAIQRIARAQDKAQAPSKKLAVRAGRLIDGKNDTPIANALILVEGDKAVVHWRGKIRSTVTGEIVDTELVDLFEFKDGRISSFVEFCDTALAARLMQANDAPPVAAM